MNNVLEKIKQPLKEMYKSNIWYCILLLVPAIVLISATSFASSITFVTNNIFLSFFISFLVVFLLLFIVGSVICPFLYTITCQIANSTRFEGKKIKLKEGFKECLNYNRDPYRIFVTLLISILIQILASIIIGLIISAIARGCSKDMYDALVETVRKMNADTANATQVLQDFLNQYKNVILGYRSATLSCTMFVTIVYIMCSIRKSESVFFTCNILFTDNRMNTKSGQFVPFFKKLVLPLVSKEHRQLDIKTNLLGYIVFVVVYFGISIGFIFITDLPRMYIPFIALFVSLLAYSPFYVRERMFDYLFYTAYSDVILERANPAVSTLIMQTREAYMTTYNFQNEDEIVVDDNAKTNDSTTNDNESKKGQIDQDGTIDFTKSDSDSHKE